MIPTRSINKILSSASVLLFLAGIFIIFAISLGIFWGELEANIYFTQNADGILKIKCPLVLSPSEAGTIRATITNSIAEDTKPMVAARISREKGTQDTSETLILAPGESQALEWRVDRSNIIFDRLILVTIIQSRYSKLDSRQGACGILIVSLFGLTGLWSLGLALTVSLLLILSASILWFRNHSERDEHSNKVIRIGRVFAGLAFAAMFSAFFRWWGLILFFDFLVLITLIVAFTEIALPPSGNV